MSAKTGVTCSGVISRTCPLTRWPPYVRRFASTTAPRKARRTLASCSLSTLTSSVRPAVSSTKYSAPSNPITLKCVSSSRTFRWSRSTPGAMTAALAGRCAYQQNHEAFWKLHDSIFDNQDVISPENAWQKMLDLAEQAGLDTGALRTCMSSPQTTQLVMETVKEGQSLKIGNTPTVFVNGRRLIGADRTLLEQFINYELATHPPPLPTKSPQQSEPLQ